MTVDRTIKGRRPAFVTGDTNANLNSLLAMIEALSAEVAVLRDRNHILEQVLAGHSVVELSQIEAFEPDTEDLAERMEWQARYLRRVHYDLERQADAEAASAYDPE